MSIVKAKLEEIIEVITESIKANPNSIETDEHPGGSDYPGHLDIDIDFDTATLAKVEMLIGEVYLAGVTYGKSVVRSDIYRFMDELGQ